MTKKNNTTSFAILIPTYNEKDNIMPLFNDLQKSLKKLKYDFTYIYIDSKSPDGTLDVIKEIQAKHDNVELVIDGKNGLGSAILMGYNKVFHKIKADYVVQMDGDLSHDPKDLAVMIEKIVSDENIAMVIGSRYEVGGMIPGYWGLNRIIASIAANKLIYYIGGLPKYITDATTGFRITKTSILKKTNYKAIKDIRGYSMTVFMVNEVLTQSPNIVSVPITFRDRTNGESKIKIVKYGLESLLVYWRLNNPSPLRAFINKLSIFVAFFATISISSLIVFTNFGLIQLIGTISIIIITTSYFLLIRNLNNTQSKNVKG